MTTVREILDKKGHDVVTISPDATVREAARVMREKRIGALVIFDASVGGTGVFTERDVMTRVVSEGCDPEKTCVRDVMSNPRERNLTQRKSLNKSRAIFNLRRRRKALTLRSSADKMHSKRMQSNKMLSPRPSCRCCGALIKISN